MDGDKQTFKIPSWRLEAVQERLTKIARRASKKGLTPFSFTLGQKGTDERKRYVGESVLHPDGYETRIIEWQEVEISAPAVKLNGWRFVARIEHLRSDDGETVNLIYAAPNNTVDAKYQTATPNCDHCHVNRYRVDTFVVAHDDGTVKQVGSTCLSDFLGVDAANFMAAASFISDALAVCSGDDDEGFGSGSHWPTAYPLAEILTVAAADVMTRGYWSRNKADIACKPATGQLVRDYLHERKPEARERMIPPAAFNDNSRKLATDTLAWLDQLADQELANLDDYLRNLAVLGKLGYCPLKAVGILASAVFAYQRNQEKQTVADKSHHQGTVGQKLGLTGNCLQLQVTMTRGYEGFRGNGTIVKFQDADGNLFIWFSSTPQSQLGFQPGEWKAVVAAVKAHDTDRFQNNAPITVLTRPEFDHDKILAARAKEAKRLAKAAKQAQLA